MTGRSLPKPSSHRPDPRIKDSHCAECGMATRTAEFHPHAFCVWKKAGQDPWKLLLWINESLGLDVSHWPSEPPLIRDLPRRER